MTSFLDRPLVKICGLRTLELAQATSDAGADLIGFVFAASRRQVSPDEVRPIVDGLRGNAIPTGLFVDQSVEEINAIAAVSGIRMLQLHWRANERDLSEFELPYYLVRRTEPGATYDTVAPDLERVSKRSNPPEWFMVDAYHPSASGGTGLLADWELSAQLARNFPVMLAGGLNPEIVADAIGVVRPSAVDVSSGVEVEEAKSPELIRAFVANARAGFARYSSSSVMTTQS